MVLQFFFIFLEKEIGG